MVDSAPNWEEVLDVMEHLFDTRHPNFQGLREAKSVILDQIAQDEDHPYPDDWDMREDGTTPIPLIEATIDTAELLYQGWGDLGPEWRQRYMNLLLEAKQEWDKHSYFSNLN